MNLSKNEYEILKRFEAVDEIADFKDPELSDSINPMSSLGLIRAASYTRSDFGGVALINHPLSYEITQEGRAALREYERERRSHIFSVITGNLISFILGVLASVVAARFF